MNRKKHAKKEIEDAIHFAESKGWTIKPSGSSAHAWGILRCPNNSQDCLCGEFCSMSIWSTPKSSANHAKQIRRVVDNCIFQRNN